MRYRIYCLLITAVLLASAAYSLCRKGAVNAIENGVSKPIFLIDPGHGGEDGGAVGSDGTRESGINLSIGLRTDAILGLFGYSCVLTREEEELVYPAEANTVRKRKRADLERRASLVNSTPNAVLLSIHQNKYSTSGPKGAQILYRDDADSILFAECMQRIMTSGIGGVRTPAPISDDVYLLRSVRCPAILVECGFLSNQEELRLLRSGSYQLKLALCLACGCAEYTEEWEKAYGQGGKG